jgi:diguanylate cyclase (GGDEF)-like protein
VQIDSFTIMVAACAGIFLFGGAFVFFWWQDRKSSWLAWWIGPYLLGGMGIVLFIPRGIISDWISIGIANALLFMAFGLVWQGARVFTGRKPNFAPIIAPPVAWMCLCAVPGFTETQTLRIVIASALIACLTLLTARELWTDKGERLPSRRAAIAVLVSFSVLIALRIPFVGYLPFPMGGGALSPNWLGFMNLVVLSHVGAFAFLMVSLTKERREAEQRNFAMLDPLTGLMNRRAFMSALERANRRRAGYARESLALLVLDLDSFKQINDRFGHEVGDRVLVAFAQIAESVTRPTDQLYRMGGEEFCFILPDTDLKDAIGSAERIRQAFALSSVDARGIAVEATVSIGVASADHAGFDLELLLEAADAAVYEAKARGRNQVVVADATALRRPVTGSPASVRRRA